MQIFVSTSSLLSAVLLIYYYLKLAIAQGAGGCPPTDEQLKPIRNDLKREYEPVKSNQFSTGFHRKVLKVCTIF